MGFKQRWNLWRRRCLKQPVDEIHQAGDNSELRLEKLTRAAGRKNNWSVHGSVRIPDPDGGRREIDLILISGSVVLVVEQKHWSGRFEVKEDGEFIQHRNNGTMHSHATVAHRIARKTRLLTEIHAQRYPDDKLDIQTFVAMTHQRLEWPKNMPELPATMLNEKQLLALLQKRGGGEENPRIMETMAGFGTWDEIHMHGGLKVKGDLLSLGLGTGVEEWDATRQGGLTATCTHPRSILTLLKPKLSKIHLNDESGRNIELKCKDGPAVKMHVVGRTQAEDIDWMMIDSIDASKRPMEWG